MTTALHIAGVLALILGPVVIPSAMLAWAAFSDRKTGAAQS
jgi:hypothetical protein